MKYLLIFLALVLILTGAFYALAENKKINLHKNTSKKPMINKTYTNTILFGAGCFWGVEKLFKNQTGVLQTQVGYADGTSASPNYKEITKHTNKFNPDNHAEVIEVIFDQEKTSVEDLIKVFFENHNPTQADGQGNDIGTQYRSLILVKNSNYAKIATQLKSEYQIELQKAGFGSIKTQIKNLEKFYPAEDYHQDYLAKNPFGYCPNHATGVKFLKSDHKKFTQVKNNENTKNEKSAKQKQQKLPKAPLAFLQALEKTIQKDKSILVVDMENCGFCEAFKSTIGDIYKGDLALNYVDIEDFNLLNLNYKVEATPTILFVEKGKIAFVHMGNLAPKDFYLALGKFKLGELSEAFKVAFENGTDAKFCKKYDLFKNTGAGVFVDKLSGAELFLTKDRFNSGSGWLSFSDAVKNSVYLLEDNSYGMQRIEVRSKSSDIHLGHLFYDGANGGARYCINATVLNFIPNQQLK